MMEFLKEFRKKYIPLIRHSSLSCVPPSPPGEGNGPFEKALGRELYAPSPRNDLP